MQNTFLTEVQILALNTVVNKIPSEHLGKLVSPKKSLRIQAYKAIQTILQENMEKDDDTRHEFSLFLAESGEVLHALSYMLTTLEVETSSQGERAI